MKVQGSNLCQTIKHVKYIKYDEKQFLCKIICSNSPHHMHTHIHKNTHKHTHTHTEVFPEFVVPLELKNSLLHEFVNQTRVRFLKVTRNCQLYKKVTI